MTSLLSRLSLNQNLAIICGGMCLLVSLTLVLVSSLSSRFILAEQEANYGNTIALKSAADVGAIIGRGDLIGLEVALESIVSLNQLRGITVYDVEQRQIGAAGSQADRAYSSAVTVAGKIAGELHVYLRENRAMREQQSLAASLIMLALLLSLFVAALTHRLARSPSERLRRLIETLQLDTPADRGGNELETLEQAVRQLPLELLQPQAGAKAEPADYETAGLLYIRLDSLASYVETLDENALLHYTDFQHALIASAAELYQGELLVVRQFGVLVSFSGQRKSAPPVFRAASTAWIVRQLTNSLQKRANLKLDVSLCVGMSEAGAVISGDFYSALYCQHIIDEMESLVLSKATRDIQFTGDAAQDIGILNAANLVADGRGGHRLEGFPAPADNLLERQHQLLQKKLSGGL